MRWNLPFRQASKNRTEIDLNLLARSNLTCRRLFVIQFRLFTMAAHFLVQRHPSHSWSPVSEFGQSYSEAHDVYSYSDSDTGGCFHQS
jgi:hypothetical protein